MPARGCAAGVGTTGSKTGASCLPGNLEYSLTKCHKYSYWQMKRFQRVFCSSIGLFIPEAGSSSVSQMNTVLQDGGKRLCIDSFTVIISPTPGSEQP